MRAKMQRQDCATHTRANISQKLPLVRLLVTSQILAQCVEFSHLCIVFPLLFIQMFVYLSVHISLHSLAIPTHLLFHSGPRSLEMESGSACCALYAI